ncbi:MAG: hypothetical protein JWM74_3366, partial [Myxococcaceae bacterium]|nr:hypothetical protein [Myxococcaceae bacterium]
CNYPGGGARLFADVLPIEHALIAVAVAHALPKLAFPQRVLGLLAIACFGFSIHAAYAHEALAQRDGGHPMYEPDVAREAHLEFGLLFFDTDHGFNLAYDPQVASSHGVMAVRLRNDDGDRILYDVLGHPASHAYRFHRDGTLPVVESFIPSGPFADAWRFETEVEWPPLAQAGGYAELAWAAGTGASLDRVLDVIPTGAGPTREAWAEIDLPIPPKPRVPLEALGARAFSTWRVTPRVLLRGVKANGTMRLFTLDAQGGSRTERAAWEWTDDPAQPSHRTLDLPARDIPPDTVRARLVITARQNKVSVDKTTVEVHR